MIKSDTEEKMSTYLIIEALYKLRKITEESHEEYLKYNKLISLKNILINI